LCADRKSWNEIVTPILVDFGEMLEVESSKPESKLHVIARKNKSLLHEQAQNPDMWGL
jgi:hypothetical protein